MVVCCRTTNVALIFRIVNAYFLVWDKYPAEVLALNRKTPAAWGSRRGEWLLVMAALRMPQQEQDGSNKDVDNGDGNPDLFI